MQKTFSHPTTQPALRCSTQGWLFNSTKNQRRLACWTSMISWKRWKVMIRDAVSCTFALFVHFHNAVRFPSQCTQRSSRLRSCDARWTGEVPHGGAAAGDNEHEGSRHQHLWSLPWSTMIHGPSVANDASKKVWNHPPRFHGFVKHLDTSRIRTGSSSVPDWSIFLLRSEIFLAGQRVDGGTLSSPIPS